MPAYCVMYRNEIRARTIINYLNRLFLGNVCEITGPRIPLVEFDYYPAPTKTEEWYLNRIRWSQDASVTKWTGIGAGFCDLPDQGDPILRFGRFQEEDLYVFRSRSVWHIMPTLDPYSVIKYEGPISLNGIWAPNSLQRIEMTPSASDARFRLSAQSSFIYLGNDDFYRLDASGGESIGKPIREEFFRLVDPTLLPRAWSFLDVSHHKYYLVAPLSGGEAWAGFIEFPPQIAWIYDWEEKTWSKQSFGTEDNPPYITTVVASPPLMQLNEITLPTTHVLALGDFASPRTESLTKSMGVGEYHVEMYDHVVATEEALTIVRP